MFYNSHKTHAPAWLPKEKRASQILGLSSQHLTNYHMTFNLMFDSLPWTLSFDIQFLSRDPSVCFSLQVNHKPLKDGRMFSILTSTHFHSAYVMWCLSRWPGLCPQEMSDQYGWTERIHWLVSTLILETDKPQGSGLCWPVACPLIWQFPSSHPPPSLLVQMQRHRSYPYYNLCSHSSWYVKVLLKYHQLSSRNMWLQKKGLYTT